MLQPLEARCGAAFAGIVGLSLNLALPLVTATAATALVAGQVMAAACPPGSTPFAESQGPPSEKVTRALRS